MSALFKSMRLPFLVLTPACLWLGVAAAAGADNPVGAGNLLLVLVGGVAAHISVNTFNEYFDFRSGLDAMTRRTPFSGGSGALVAEPAADRLVLLVAVMSLTITLLIGLYFVILRGAMLLPLGLLGIFIILSYTEWLNRNPWLCWLAPGLGFGPLMVMGTDFVLVGEYSAIAALASLVPFLLTNNLLLLNQYPDIEADRSVGRRTFPIAYGVAASNALYGASLLATAALVVLSAWLGIFPKLSVLALIPLLAGAVAFRGICKHGSRNEALLPYMGLNVLAAVLTPVVLGLALVFG